MHIGAKQQTIRFRLPWIHLYLNFGSSFSPSQAVASLRLPYLFLLAAFSKLISTLLCTNLGQQGELRQLVVRWRQELFFGSDLPPMPFTGPSIGQCELSIKLEQYDWWRWRGLACELNFASRLTRLGERLVFPQIERYFCWCSSEF